MDHWVRSDGVEYSNCWLPIFNNPVKESGFGTLKSRFEHTWFLGKPFFENYFMLLDERPSINENAGTNYVGLAPCVGNAAHVDLVDDPFGKSIPSLGPGDTGPGEPIPEPTPEKPIIPINPDDESGSAAGVVIGILIAVSVVGGGLGYYCYKRK